MELGLANIMQRVLAMAMTIGGGVGMAVAIKTGDVLQKHSIKWTLFRRRQIIIAHWWCSMSNTKHLLWLAYFESHIASGFSGEQQCDGAVARATLRFQGIF